MEKPYVNLKLSIEQAKSLSEICETFARLMSGQMDILRDTIAPSLDWDDCSVIKKICFPKLNNNNYIGIGNDGMSDIGKQSWDMYQVIRHHLSWRTQTNTPETRDFSKQMTVNFDDPMRKSIKCPLPEIEEIKDEE